MSAGLGGLAGSVGWELEAWRRGRVSFEVVRDPWEPVICWGGRWRPRTRPALVLEVSRRGSVVRLGSAREAAEDLAAVWCGPRREAERAAAHLLEGVIALARAERAARSLVLLDWRAGGGVEIFAGGAWAWVWPVWRRGVWRWTARGDRAALALLGGLSTPCGRALKIFWHGDKKIT